MNTRLWDNLLSGGEQLRSVHTPARTMRARQIIIKTTLKSFLIICKDLDIIKHQTHEIT